MSRLLPLLLLLLGAARGTETSKLQRTVGAGAGTPKASGTAMPTSPSDSETFNAVEASESQRVLKPERTIPSPLAPSRTMKGSRMAAMVEGSHLYGKRTRKPVHGSPGEAPTEMASILVSNEPVSLPVRREATGTLKRTSQHTRVSSQPSKMAPSLAKPPTNETIQQARRASAARKPQGVSTKPLKEACTQPHCTRAPSIPGNPSRVPAAASSTHRPVAMVTGSQRRDSDSSEQTHQSGSEGNVLHKRGNGFREPGRAARLYVANGGGTASGDPGSQRVQTVPGRSRPPGNKLPAASAPPASPPPSSSEDSLARSSVTRESTRPVGMATGASKSKTFTEQKASESARTRGPKANFSAMGLRLQPGKLRVLAPTGVTMPTTGVPTGPARLGSLQAMPFTGARTANTIPTSKDTTASQGQAGLRRTLTPSVSGHPRTSSLASNSVSKEGTPKAFSTVRTSGPSRISGLVDQFQGQSARAPHYPLSAFPESVLGSVAGNLSLLNKRDFASLSTWELVTTDYQPAIKLTAQAKKPPTVKITPAKQATLRSTTSVGSSRLPPQSTPEISSVRKLAALPIHSSQVPTTQANQKTTSRYHFLSEPNTLVNQIAPALTTETYLSPDRRTSAHHSPQKLTALANQRPPKLTIPVNPRPRELTTTANQIPPELTTPETPFSPDTTIAGDSPVTKLYTLVDSFPSSPSKSVLSTSPLTKKRPNHSPTKPNAPKNHPLSERIPPSGHTLPEPAMPANQLLSILPIQENHYLKKLTTPANLSTQQATPTQQVSTPAALSSPELPTPSTYSLPELTTPSKNSTVKHGKVAEHATPDLTLQVNRFTSELNTPANHYLPEQAETLSEPAFPSDQTALENLFTARSTPETKRLTEPIISSNTAPRQLTRAEDQSSTESSTQAELSKAYVQDLNTLARKFIPKQNPKTANPPVELSVTENQTQLYLITHLRPQPAKQTVPTHLLSSDWTAPVSQISQEKLTYERGSHLQTTAPPLYRTREKQFTPNKRPLEQMSTVDHFLKEITTPVYHLPPGLFTSSRKPSQRLTQAQQILSDLTTREIHALPELTTPTYHNTPELTTIVGRTASELTAPDHTLSELDISAGPTTSELTTEKGHTASEITTHMIYNAADLTTPIGNTALRSATPASDTTSKLRTSVDHTTTLLSTSVDHTISEITIPVDHTRSELTAVVDHPALRPTTPAGPTTSKLITSVSDTTSKLTTTAPHTTMKLTTPVRHTTFERTMPTGHTESKITTPVDLTTSKVVTLVDHTTLKATTAAFGQTSNLDISVSETPPDVTTPIFHPQSTIPYGTGSETPHVSTEKRSPFVPANNEHSGVTQWTVPHHTSKNHTLPNQTTETPEISSSWYVTSTGTTRRTQTAGEFISWQASTSSPTGGTKVQQATTRHDSSTGHAEGPKLAAEPSFWPTVTSGQTEVSKVPGHVNLWYTPTADRTESSELPKESDSHYKSSAFPTADAKVTRPWYAQSPYPTGGSDVSNESSSWQSVSSPTVKPSGKTLNVPEIFTSTAKNGTSSSGIFVPGEASTLPTPSGGQSGITNFEMTTNSIRMKSTVIHHQFPTTSPVNTHPHPTHRTSLSTSHHSTSRGVPERAGRIFIVEDQPPILKASEVDVAFQLALDMVYIRNLERVDSLQRQDLVHAFQETVSPFYKSVPGFVRLEVLGFREGSVILDYIAVFNLESVNLLMMEQPERLLNLSRLPLAITSGLWVAGHRVMGVSVTERWADLCGKAYSCLAGFVCAHARNGNITCTSLCHDGFCKNEGICTHRRGQEPMCQCPVGSDYWFMGERCDYRMTQQALLGISCGVILSLILCISAIAYLAMRRFKALLVETKINQTKSSYRRFSRFDDISTRYWSHSQSQSWLGASISSLDNLAFSHSEEVLHLHAMESRRGSSPEDADPAGTCSPRSTPHRRPECRPGFHSDWETSCSSFNDPMVDSGKASAISVSSWPMEPIQWTPFPILHQLTAHSPDCPPAGSPGSRPPGVFALKKRIPNDSFL